MDKIAETDVDIQCPLRHVCGILGDNREMMPKLIDRIRQCYCTHPCPSCARLKVARALGADAVPDLMLPGQTRWAAQLIEDIRRDDTS